MRGERHRGILKRTAAADSYPIAQPTLTPHLEFRRIDDDLVLLVSESFNTLLRGPIHRDLLPLLVDSGLSHDGIVAALSGTHSARAVQTALFSLAARGYVVSGAHGMERGQAAYWSALGASPCWAEERLTRSQVALDTGNDGVARGLDAMGVTVGTDDPALSVYLCQDYLEERFGAVNRRHAATGSPWLLVRPNGIQPLFGPIFRPAEQGPCWACLAYRLNGHHEVHAFLRNRGGEQAAFRPHAGAPAVLDAISGLVAAEIAKWLVFREAAPLHEHAISLDIALLKSHHHPTMRRPQCRVCGDEALYRADRPALPVRLHSRPKTMRNSGGIRSVPPEETLARYRHLVSPVSGIVTRVSRATMETDPWLHVHTAGNNLALRVRSLSSLRRSLRSKAAGKGSTAGQSEASAFCEAVERYSSAFHGDEIRCRKRFEDFTAGGQAEAIHPNDVQLFSDWQLTHAGEINARGHPQNFVPPRFDPEREIDWSPVWSLTRNRHRWLPTSILYSMVPEQRGGANLWADSNGCAAGNTLEEAVLQGFFELVERDAFAIWWYNRICLPALDLGSFGCAYLVRAADYYRGQHRDIWVLDATSDLGIPVFVALSRRVDSESEEIIYAAGAHTDPQIAALRAVCELNQTLAWVPRPGDAQPRHVIDDPMCLEWWRNARLADHPHLAPASGAAPRRASDYAVPDTEDLKEEVDRCRALVEAQGMEFLVLDQTRPDVGMPVVRVIVPGLRHFWERFAPGRLFDVPVKMGWRNAPLPEADLNPVPVIG